MAKKFDYYNNHQLKGFIMTKKRKTWLTLLAAIITALATTMVQWGEAQLGKKNTQQIQDIVMPLSHELLEEWNAQQKEQNLPTIEQIPAELKKKKKKLLEKYKIENLGKSHHSVARKRPAAGQKKGKTTQKNGLD